MQNTTEKIFPVLGTDVASGANISLPLINDITAGKITSGNVIITGNDDSGLTYRTKLMMLRYYKAGYRVLGVAPHFGQKLFGKFAEQCGGQVLTLGKDCFINIMGIVPVVKRGKSLESNIKLAKETLDDRVAVVSNFVELVCGNLDEAQLALLESAILRTYSRFGIDMESYTLLNQNFFKMPILSDLVGDMRQHAILLDVADRLNNFISKEGKCFNVQTSVQFVGQMNIIDVSMIGEKYDLQRYNAPAGAVVLDYLAQVAKSDSESPTVVAYDDFMIHLGLLHISKARTMLTNTLCKAAKQGWIFIGNTSYIDDFIYFTDSLRGKYKYIVVLAHDFKEHGRLAETFGFQVGDWSKLAVDHFQTKWNPVAMLFNGESEPGKYQIIRSKADDAEEQIVSAIDTAL